MANREAKDSVQCWTGVRYTSSSPMVPKRATNQRVGLQVKVEDTKLQSFIDLVPDLIDCFSLLISSVFVLSIHK